MFNLFKKTPTPSEAPDANKETPDPEMNTERVKT